MRASFRQKNGLAMQGGQTTAQIASPAMIKKKSNADRAGGLAKKNFEAMLDSDDDDEEEESSTRAAGPAIGVASLDQKRPPGLQALKMPKLKQGGESVQKA